MYWSKPRGGEPRTEHRKALRSCSSRRIWGQLGEHSHLRNHPHRELRGKCSKKEAVGCDTGCGQASEVSGALSDFQAHCKLKQREESSPSCTVKADRAELAQVPPRIPHSLPVLAQLSVPKTWWRHPQTSWTVVFDPGKS